MILIVDDSATNQVLMEAILQEEGLETITAFSAREAFKLIEKERPKLILLDLLMPEVSGIDFLKQFRQIESYTNIPVIIVSAVSTRENMDECKELGASDFFAKPINIPLFIKRVRSLISA